MNTRQHLSFSVRLNDPELLLRVLWLHIVHTPSSFWESTHTSAYKKRRTTERNIYVFFVIKYNPSNSSWPIVTVRVENSQLLLFYGLLLWIITRFQNVLSNTVFSNFFNKKKKKNWSPSAKANWTGDIPTIRGEWIN